MHRCGRRLTGRYVAKDERTSTCPASSVRSMHHRLFSMNGKAYDRLSLTARTFTLQIKIKEEMALAEEEEKQLDVEAWQARLKEANRKEKEKQAKIQQAKEANVQEMFRLNRLNQKRQQEVDAMIEAEEAKFLEQALQLERAAKLKEQQHTAERAAVLEPCVSIALSPESPTHHAYLLRIRSHL